MATLIAQPTVFFDNCSSECQSGPLSRSQLHYIRRILRVGVEGDGMLNLFLKAKYFAPLTIPHDNVQVFREDLRPFSQRRHAGY